jgi:hypothetical protein
LSAGSQGPYLPPTRYYMPIWYINEMISRVLHDRLCQHVGWRKHENTTTDKLALKELEHGIDGLPEQRRDWTSLFLDYMNFA